MAREFARLGCELVDADSQSGHELLVDDDVRRQLRQRWGTGIFNDDGGVDRQALGAIVFADAAELVALNSILHPRIRRRMAEQIDRAQSRAETAAVVVDAPLLFEAGCEKLCSHLVFVDCPAEIRAQRVKDHRGWDRRNWKARETSQNSLDTKAAMCDYYYWKQFRCIPPG